MPGIDGIPPGKANGKETVDEKGWLLFVFTESEENTGSSVICAENFRKESYVMRLLFCKKR